MTAAVDYFAGAGGWSTGAALAGIEVRAAVNHWARAVETHSANHPATRHYCQDAALIDPRELPAHDVFVASPACQGHSRARGTDRPHHDASRATAWCVVNAVEVCRPRWLAVENVPEFRAWALYPMWRAALAALGYAVGEHVLDAADFGAAQERRRLIVVAERDRPAPRIEAPGLAPAPARSVLDLDAGPWSPVAGHAPRTLARIAAAQAAHGPDVLVAYYGSARGGRPLARPLGTLTTRDRYALVRGDRMRMLSVEEQRRAQGFPDGYRLAGTRREQVHQLGNAVHVAVARGVLGQLCGDYARARSAA